MFSFRRASRRRRTQAVLSDRPDRQAWWDAPLTETVSARARAKELRFRSGDPFERFVVLRHVIVAVSLLAPVIIFCNVDLTPGAEHHDWDKDPMAEVQRCLTEGKSRHALASLKGELGAHPDDPKLLRALIALTADTAPAEARRAFHRLNALGLASPSDVAAHAAILAKLHDFTGAKAILSNLPKDAQELPEALFAWLAVWREAADFASAATTLDKLLSLSPGEAKIAIDLLVRAAQSGAPTDTLHHIEGSLVRSLAFLMNKGRAQDVLALAPRLTSLPLTNAVYRMHLGQVLRNLPGQNLEYRLAAVRYGHPAQLPAADEARLRADYQNEIAWSGGLSAEDKDRVADYLQTQDEHTMVTTLISAREALTEPQLFARRFESLLELGLWREAGAMSAAHEAPTLPHSRVLAQTLATLQRRDSRIHAVELLVNEAIDAARSEHRALDCYAIGTAALDHRLPIMAATAFATALDISNDRPRTLRAVMKSARQGGLPLGTLLRSLVGSPAMQDEAIQQQLIYLSLLCDQKTDAMLAIVRTRRQNEPGNVYLRFLEALALHRTGQHSEAAGLLMPLPQFRWHQGEAAVIASIIATSGQIDRTASLIRQIDPSQLLLEERDLFAPWQSRAGAAGGLVGSISSE